MGCTHLMYSLYIDCFTSFPGHRQFMYRRLTIILFWFLHLIYSGTPLYGHSLIRTPSYNGQFCLSRRHIFSLISAHLIVWFQKISILPPWKDFWFESPHPPGYFQFRFMNTAFLCKFLLRDPTPSEFSFLGVGTMQIFWNRTIQLKFLCKQRQSVNITILVLIMLCIYCGINTH